MSLAERQKAIETARNYERTGNLGKALELYRRFEAIDDVVRVLIALKRHPDAAEYLLEQLPPLEGNLSALRPEQRRHALNAAVLLSKLGDVKRAVNIMLAIGERLRAADVLEKSGDLLGAAKLRGKGQAGGAGAMLPDGSGPVGAVSVEAARRLESQGKLPSALQVYVHAKQWKDAARVAAQLGQHAQAAEMFLDAGLPYESAQLYVTAGNYPKALESFQRVSPTDLRYRHICNEAVRLAMTVGATTLQFEYFIDPFLKAPPESEKDLETMYVLVQVYEKQGFFENAKEVLDRLLQLAPKYRDAAAVRQRLEKSARGDVESFRRVLEEDTAFQRANRRPGMTPGRGGAGDLPPLPDLPDLPPLPSPSAPASAGGQQHPPPTSGQHPQYVPSPHGQYPGQQQYAPPYAPSPYPAPSSGQHPQYVPQPQHYPPSSGQHAQYVPPAASPYQPVSGQHPPYVPPPQHQYPPQQQQQQQFGAPQATPMVMGQQLEGTFVTPGAPMMNEQPANLPPPPPSAPPKSVWQVGGLINGRYELTRALGQGGMGMVFQAHDKELSEDIAIKVFTAATNENALARFKQEIKLARKLVHPNIVRLFDFGTDAGAAYITMELLRGHELRHEMKNKAIALERGIQLLVQACAGLYAAHQQGVIHRDIKPENLFITSDGVLKVMDFGIAKGKAAEGVTVSGTVAGTPEYMAPEQVSNFTSVSHQADLYSLGIIAYEMFTGAVPFKHAELMPLLMMQMKQAPEPPRYRNPDVSPELDRVIMRLLEKEPIKRFSDCRETASAFSACLATF